MSPLWSEHAVGPGKSHSGISGPHLPCECPRDDRRRREVRESTQIGHYFVRRLEHSIRLLSAFSLAIFMCVGCAHMITRV